MRRAGEWLGVTVLLAGSVGCLGGRNFGDFCEERVDCQDGNDADREACEVENGAEEERASLFGCAAEFDLFAACAEEESSCENDVYTFEDDCEDEARDYSNCMSDGAPAVQGGSSS
ncbi:MAG: hypothetical protein AAGN82_28670 [Myxococcota bacterium]